MTLVATEEALVEVKWHGLETPADEANQILKIAASQLDEYFGGHRRAFDLPLSLRGTPFQIKVWNALKQIPFGDVITYAEQARRLKIPNACRAVGAANGRNPLSLFVPCHRVVGTNQKLTGFAGGLPAKAHLLELEKRVLAATGETSPHNHSPQIQLCLR